jgi:hypothetical protein
VTSVALSAPSEFTVSGSPVTSSGTLALAKANQSANQVWAGPASSVTTLLSDEFPGSTLDAGWLEGISGSRAKFTVSSATLHYATTGIAHIYRGSAWTDYTFTWTMTMLDSYPTNPVISFRINSSTGAHYVLVPNAFSANWTLYKTTDWNYFDGATSIAVASGITIDNAAHNYSVQVAGSSITFQIDGVTRITATDSTLASGPVGIECNNNSTNYQHILVVGAGGGSGAPAFRALVSADLPASPGLAGNPQAPVLWIPYKLASNLVAPSDCQAHIPGMLSVPSGFLVDLSASTGYTLLEVM